MSEINQLAEKIKQNALEESDRMIAEALEKKESRMIASREEIDAQEKKRLAIARQHIKKEVQQAQSTAQLAIRDDQLAFRQSEIDKVFIAAEHQLQQLSKADFQRVVQYHLKELSVKGEIVLSVGEYSAAQIDVAAIEQLNQELISNQQSIKLSHELVFGKSGFIFHQSGVEFNYLFEDVLHRLKEEMVPEIAAVLFQ